MPVYEHPGVFIEEVNRGTRPIEGVGTTMAAFVGLAPAGPANKPVLITSWTQYLETFGAVGPGGIRNPHLDNAYLSHAVYGYFQNGGGRCYIVRVASDNEQQKALPPVQATIPSRASASTQAVAPSLRVVSKQPTNGTVPSVQIIIEPASKIPHSASAQPKPADAKPADAKPVAHDGKPADGKPAASGAKPDDAPKDEAGAAGPSRETGLSVNAPDEVFFSMRVKSGTVEERYDNKSMRTLVEEVNRRSGLISLEVPSANNAHLPERAPRVGNYSLSLPPTEPVDQTRDVSYQSFRGEAADRSGIDGLEISEDVTMLCCPDLMALYENKVLDEDGVAGLQHQMMAHCKRMGDRVAILDAPPNMSVQQVREWRDRVNYDNDYAALYYPWIKVPGPDGKPMAVPPCGHVAGIYARSDRERGVHKAPANEVVLAATDAVMPVSNNEQDLLNPRGINCIRSLPGRGLRVWGARTLSSDPAWRYVSVRRLFNYIEKSIEMGTQWIVFEPNDADLWARVRRDVSAFLTGVWRDGMLFGATPSEAFYVKCDAETNPPDVRDRGQLIIELGLAPVKPAEFVVFRIGQWAGGGQ